MIELFKMLLKYQDERVDKLSWQIIFVYRTSKGTLQWYLNID